MKLLICVLLMCASALAETLPPNAALLRAKRDAKIAEINRIYAAELDKLQKKAMSTGNLTAATALQKEIDEVTPDPFKEEVLVGKWKMVGPSGVVVTREFTQTHLIDETGGKHPYEINGSTLTIKWGDTLWEKLDMKDLRLGVLTGTNSGGGTLVYRNR